MSGGVSLNPYTDKVAVSARLNISGITQLSNVTFVKECIFLKHVSVMGLMSKICKSSCDASKMLWIELVSGAANF